MKKVLTSAFVKTPDAKPARTHILDLRRTLRLTWLALFGLALHGAALAQTPDPASGITPHGDTVSWSAQAAPVSKGDKLKLTVSGTIQTGWHVYGLKQAPEGPTPLVVALDQNSVAAADGAVTGSPTTKYHDPAFGVDTQFYSSAFTLTLPVRLKQHAGAAGQAIPVAVRFQTCNGRICQPPKTVHLSATVNPEAGG